MRAQWYDWGTTTRCLEETMIKPSRVGHATFETPDLDKALAYYVEVNGLKLAARENGRAYLASKTGLLTLAPPPRTSAAGLKDGSLPVGTKVTAHGHRARDNNRYEVKTERITVDGKTYKGKSTHDVVGDIRGKPGDVVTLSVLRDDKLLPFKVTRGVVATEEVKGTTLPGAIGYVRIHGFSAKT